MTQKRVNLKERRRYPTMERLDKSDLFTDNEVPSLGAVLHSPCHPDVAYCAFPRVIFPTYAPVILKKIIAVNQDKQPFMRYPATLTEVVPTPLSS